MAAVFSQKPGERKDYPVGWSGLAEGSDAVASSAWVLDPSGDGATLDGEWTQGDETGMFLSGLVAGTVYRATNTVETTAGREGVHTIVVICGVEDTILVPLAGALCTPASVKERAGISPDDYSRENEVRRAILAASAEAEAHCRRPFARRRLTETRPVEGGRVLLDLTPLVAVHSVSVDGEAMLGFSVEDAAAGILGGVGSGLLGEGEARWWNDPYRGAARGPRRATVEYTGGFVPPYPAPPGEDDPPRDLPHDIEAAVVELAAAKLGGAGAGGGSGYPIRSKSIGPLSVSYDTGGASAATGAGAQLSVWDRLDRWRREA